MRLCRYDNNRIGLVRGSMVHDVTAALDELPPLKYPAPWGDHLIAHLDTLRPAMEKLADKAAGVPIDQVRFLSPVANPSKIIGTPANYHAHVEEARNDAEIAVYNAGRQRSLHEQGLFLKASSTLVGPSEGVTVRFPDRRTDHEAELGVVIGKKVTSVSVEDALSVVAGYAIALDMVIRGKEDRSYRKSLETYAVLGPWMVTADELGDPGDLNFTLHVNGQLRQAANTKEMILNIAQQISWATSIYTLHPGDIIMSGTCAGVGPVVPGDTMVLDFDRIGQMTVPIK